MGACMSNHRDGATLLHKPMLPSGVLVQPVTYDHLEWEADGEALALKVQEVLDQLYCDELYQKQKAGMDNGSIYGITPVGLSVFFLLTGLANISKEGLPDIRNEEKSEDASWVRVGAQRRGPPANNGPSGMMSHRPSQMAAFPGKPPGTRHVSQQQKKKNHDWKKRSGIFSVPTQFECVPHNAGEPYVIRRGTMEWIVNYVVKPLGKAKQCSIIELLMGVKSKGRACIGFATHFHSYTWQEPPQTTIVALASFVNEHFFESVECADGIWWDLFCQNQHNSGNVMSTFDHAIAQCEILMLSIPRPSEPLYLQRVWCLFETLTWVRKHMHADEEDDRAITTILLTNKRAWTAEDRMAFALMKNKVFKKSHKILDDLTDKEKEVLHKMDIDVMKAHAAREEDEVMIRRIFRDRFEGRGQEWINEHVFKNIIYSSLRLILRNGS